MTQNLRQILASQVRAISGRPVDRSATVELWQGLSATVIGQVANRWTKTSDTYAKRRQGHYFSAKFLMGHALLNNPSNLGLVNEARQALAEYGQDLSLVLEEEPGAALENNGLGRFAACFLGSCTTLDLPATGYGILYRYSLFEQLFNKDLQTEHPDPRMEENYPFVIRREEAQRIVSYADLTVRAVPYDMPITDYGTKNINTLYLWRARPVEEFDYDAFNSQRFTEVIIDYGRTNDISRVLYPNDTTFEDKVLRVRQRYFFCSASLQAIVDNYVEHHGEGLSNFAGYDAVQLNDTHPILTIPELMRLLMGEHGLGWGDAWKVVSNILAYTNHTVLAGVLKKWEMTIFDRLFPHIAEIVREIGRRFRTDMAERGLDRAAIDYMAPVTGNIVCMARIICYASYSINGIAAPHTEIIKRETLEEWYELWPERSNNKANGVTPRRWLKQYNPRLTALLDEVAGSDAWVIDPSLLGSYLNAADDPILDQLAGIKHENKADFAAWAKKRKGVSIDPDVIFNVQIKRLHGYKRRLLGTLYVLDLYFRMKEDPSLNVPKHVFVFDAKATSGYVRAKGVIKLIDAIAKLVNNGEGIAGRVKVVFIHDYNVSPAGHIIPAANVSKQISTASREASGASNMKLMMNGALTLSTLDGADAEILNAVGEDNACISGATEGELPELCKNYDPRQHYENVPGLKRVLDALVDDTLDDNGSGWFHDLCWSLLESGYESVGMCYVLGNFAAYRKARNRMATSHAGVRAWVCKTWMNITKSGRLSSNRMIRDYAEGVWKLEATPIN